MGILGRAFTVATGHCIHQVILNTTQISVSVLRLTQWGRDRMAAIVPMGPINNIPALVQIMALHRPGNKPLSEPMVVSLLTHICVTRPRWYTINWYTMVSICTIYLWSLHFGKRPRTHVEWWKRQRDQANQVATVLSTLSITGFFCHFKQTLSICNQV